MIVEKEKIVNMIRRQGDAAFGQVTFEGRVMSPREHDIWCEGRDSLASQLAEALETLDKYKHVNLGMHTSQYDAHDTSKKIMKELLWKKENPS